jgi:hypothetical protein
MTMVGDGWLYWDAVLQQFPDDHWARRRVEQAIRITVFRTLSLELLDRLLLHQGLYTGARWILLGLEGGGGVALFDNPKVNAVYAIQKINSELALNDLRDFITRRNMEQIQDPQSVTDFELLYWIIEREFSTP